MVRYNISIPKLLSEYMTFDAKGLRFGQYILNNFSEGSDPDVYYERNNGVAYKMILNRIYQQELADSEKTS